MVDEFNIVITFFKEDCLTAEPGKVVTFPISKADVMNIKSVSDNEELLNFKFHNLVDTSGNKYDFDLNKVYGFEIRAIK